MYATLLTFSKILSTSSGLWILLHGVISLPDATLCVCAQVMGVCLRVRLLVPFYSLAIIFLKQERAACLTLIVVWLSVFYLPYDALGCSWVCD